MKYKCEKNKEFIKFYAPCDCLKKRIWCIHATSFKIETPLWEAIIKQLKKELK